MSESVSAPVTHIGPVVETTARDGDPPPYMCPECGKTAKSAAGLGRHRTTHGVVGVHSKRKPPPQLDAESVRHSLDDYDPWVIVVGRVSDEGPMVAESAVMPDRHYAKQVSQLLTRLGHKAHMFRLADSKTK